MIVDSRDDIELLDAARDGEAEAYAELYRRYRPAARAAAASLRVPRCEREDVIEEAFANILAALRKGRGPSESFRPYLIAAVRNITFSRSRAHVRAQDGYVRLTTELQTAEAVREFDTGDLVSEAFGQLPERWQHVLIAIEIEGRRPAQLAPEMGMSPNAVSALVARARRGLRSAYRDAHRREERRLAEPVEMPRAS